MTFSVSKIFQEHLDRLLCTGEFRGKINVRDDFENAFLGKFDSANRALRRRLSVGEEGDSLFLDPGTLSSLMGLGFTAVLAQPNLFGGLLKCETAIKPLPDRYDAKQMLDSVACILWPTARRR